MTRPDNHPGRADSRALWPLYVAMTIAGAAAVVASASTLAGLAHAAGWASWTPWLLPAALDVGGVAGGWCWLRPEAPARARSFGRVVALVGAAGTLVGNAAGHLVASGYLQPGPVLVVVVGAVPAGVLVALAHLATLLRDTIQPAARKTPEQGVGPVAVDSPPAELDRPHAAQDRTDAAAAAAAPAPARPATRTPAPAAAPAATTATGADLESAALAAATRIRARDNVTYVGQGRLAAELRTAGVSVGNRRLPALVSLVNTTPTAPTAPTAPPPAPSVLASQETPDA